MWKLKQQEIEEGLLKLGSPKQKIRYIDKMLYLEKVENAARPFCFKTLGDIYLELGNLREAMDCYIDTNDAKIIKAAADESFKRGSYGLAMQAYVKIEDKDSLIKVGDAALKSEKNDDLFIAGMCFEEAGHSPGLNLVAERYLERAKRPRKGVAAAWNFVEKTFHWEPDELGSAREYFKAAGNNDGLRRIKQIDDEMGYKAVGEEVATRKIEEDLEIAKTYEQTRRPKNAEKNRDRQK